MGKKIEFEKFDKNIGKPDCYNPNNDTYPLCKGKGEEVCDHCCFYVNMIEPYDYV